MRNDQTKRLIRKDAITLIKFRPKIQVIKQIPSEYCQNVTLIDNKIRKTLSTTHGQQNEFCTTFQGKSYIVDFLYTLALF